MLNLSIASGSDLARTADIVSDNMTAMGLVAGQDIAVGKNLDRKVEASKHFMDVYSYALTKSNVNLESLGETMKYAAPIAAAYGATLEDTAAMTMIMGNAGIKGSMAGTALRMGLLRLSGPPKKATKEMEALGISMSDATKMAYESQAQLQALGIQMDANAKPADKMFQVLTQLAEKTKDLGAEEKLAAVGAIFGANAASGWVNILEQGPEVFQKYRDELRDCDGYTEQVAGTMSDNLIGAFTRVDSAMEAVSLATGKAFEPLVRQSAEFAAKSIGGLAEFVSQHQTAVQWAGLLAASVSACTVAIAGASVAMAAWNFATSTIEAIRKGIIALTSVQWIQTAATHAAAAAQWLWNAAMMANPVGVAVGGILLLVGALALVVATCPSVSQALSAAWNDPQGAVHGFTELVKSATADAVDYVLERWETLKQALSNPLEAILNFADHGDVTGGNISAQKSQETVGLRRAEIAMADSPELREKISARTGGSNEASEVISAYKQIRTEEFNARLAASGNQVQQYSTQIQTLPESAQVLATSFAQAGQLTPELMTQLQAGIAPSIEQFQSAGIIITDKIHEATSQMQAFTPALQEVVAQIQTLPESAQVLATSFSQVGQLTPELMAQLQAGIAPSVEQFQTAGIAMTDRVQEAVAQMQAANPAIQNQVVNADNAANATQNLSANAEAAATSTTNLSTNAEAAATSTTNLSTNAEAAATSTTNLSAGAENAGSAANSAAGSFGGLSGAVDNVVGALNTKASQISAIKISAPSYSAPGIAANAEGGIYPKGAFLTTFAEESPEAAIPIDKSRRAVELWTKTGQMLGISSMRNAEGVMRNSTSNSVSANDVVRQKVEKQRVDQVLKQATSMRNAEGVMRNSSSNSVSANDLVRQRVEKQRVEQVLKQATSMRNAEGVMRNSEVSKQSSDYSSQNAKDITNYELRTTHYRSGLSDKVKRSRSGRALQRRREELGKRNGIIPSIISNPIPTFPTTNPSIIPEPIPTFPTNSASKSTSIFDKILNTDNRQLPTNFESLGGIFNNSQGNIFESLGGIFNGTGGNSIGDYVKNLFGGNEQNPTAITVNLTINIEGNADEKVMQKAGQEMSINFEREMQRILGNWQRDKLRGSF